MFFGSRRLPRRTIAVGVVSCGLALGACDRDPTVPLVTSDTTPPSVTILDPTGDSVTTHTIGDSLLVSVLVTDAGGVDSVVIAGFSIRGNVDTGLDEIIPRFESQLVVLDGAPVDTTVARTLVATPDGFVETALIVTTAWDGDGNASADTVSVFLDVPPTPVPELQAAGVHLRAGIMPSAHR